MALEVTFAKVRTRDKFHHAPKVHIRGEQGRTLCGLEIPSRWDSAYFWGDSERKCQRCIEFSKGEA